MSGERDLRKRVAALERRLATMIMTGTAEANQGAKTKVRFDDTGANEKPFSSPFLAQASNAGKQGQGVSTFSRIGKGEPVLVFSPGGELGEHSRVMPAGHVGDHPSPGTAEQDGHIITVGDATVSIKNGEIKITVGSSTLIITAGEIVLQTPSFKGMKS